MKDMASPLDDEWLSESPPPPPVVSARAVISSPPTIYPGQLHTAVVVLTCICIVLTYYVQKMQARLNRLEVILHHRNL